MAGKTSQLYKVMRQTAFLAEAVTPSDVFRGYFSFYGRRKSLRRRHAPRVEALRDRLKTSGRFSCDWLTGYVPFWLEAFDRFDFASRDVRALEIGSWEGMSSLFVLETLPKSRIVCVDTWQGSDEHRLNPHVEDSEAKFDANLAPFTDRMTKFKGTSSRYFQSLSPDERFDLIYVDGSHHVDDVIEDAFKAFHHASVGGLIIFDDYIWRYYPQARHNPAGAVNALLRIKRGAYELVAVYEQLIIRKIAEA